MRQGQISIYYGMGKGKTAVAVGRGMRAIGEEQRVVMIQFLDYHNSKEIALLKKLEPDFRIFRFEKDRAAEDVQKAASILKSWKNTTIRRLMPPVAPQWLWQMPSIRQWRNGIIMYMIVLRCMKKEKKPKSGFMQCAAAISSASMMSFLQAEMKSLS